MSGAVPAVPAPGMTWKTSRSLIQVLGSWSIASAWSSGRFCAVSSVE
jgi:hypothetical protein